MTHNQLKNQIQTNIFTYLALCIAKVHAQAVKKKGGNLVAPPEGFFVKDREGPLKEGELERTADWAKGIVK